MQKRYPLRYKDRSDVIMPQRFLQELARCNEGRLHLLDRRGPAPDVGRAVLPGRSRPHMAHLRAASAPWATGCPPPWARRSATAIEPVLLITGDGSFQMCIQELATCVHENLNLKIIIMNNGFLGMVRQWQELFYSRRYSRSRDEVLPRLRQDRRGLRRDGPAREQARRAARGARGGLHHAGVVLMDIIVCKKTTSTR